MDYEVKADVLDEAFEGVELRPERPVLAATGDAKVQSGFEGFVRAGVLAGVKSFTGANPSDGGVAVPRELDGRIDATLKAISPIRRIANVVKVGSAGYRKLATQNGVASGWAGETAARPETTTPSFTELQPPSGDLYANPAASQAMLDDAGFDVEEWLAGEIATEFARAEGSAFVSGNGNSRPKGFTAYATSAAGDATRAVGTLQYLPTGAVGAFSAQTAFEKLIDLIQAVKAPYRQGASFVLNSKTIAALRKYKTGDGMPLWNPSMSEGVPSQLLGYPVVEAEDMPDMAADSLSIAFGNFRAGYLIAERQETRILRDPYTNKPYVYFYATKRVGGCVTNSEAIKFLRFSVS